MGQKYGISAQSSPDLTRGVAAHHFLRPKRSRQSYGRFRYRENESSRLTLLGPMLWRFCHKKQDQEKRYAAASRITKNEDER